MTVKLIVDDEDAIILDAVTYVGELYREITEENGQPPLGTQNQVVDFIRGDPELVASVRRWAEMRREDDPVPHPPQRPPEDEAYRRIAARLKATLLETPVFERDRNS